ncbi:HsdM family class I SAM-dependent methyltransferase [Paraburkholderia sp.]|uniref:HsdM family class I SAM-dependent methyltransferase n=1 Tax=Paraburkholderia sp. TaxID=1926495 RepID=UPI002F417E86
MAKRHFVGVSLTSQIRRVQELLLARTGADEFYETIRLLVAKAFHERSRATAPLTFERAHILLTENSAEVMRFVEGVPSFSAPPDLVNECLRVLDPVKLNDIKFEALDAAFEEMTSRHYKSDKGQFFTPRHVIELCIDVLRPGKTDTVCDPACGSGAFLKAAYDYIGDSRARRLYGFEISPRASKIASLMSFLGCGDSLKIHTVDSLRVAGGTLFDGQAASIEHALADDRLAKAGFDVIATNPPFAGDVSTSEYVSNYEVANLSKTRVERDVLFIERCYQLLKPGGRMAIVLPDNKVSASKFAGLREWMIRKFEVVGVVSLHGYTFRPYTSQKASIVFARKRTGMEAGNDHMVNFYRSDKAGKTSSGEIVLADGSIDHDLDEIAQDFKREWVL